MKIYLGEIEEIDEFYQITWKLPNTLYNTTLPTATPLSKHTEQLLVGTEVLIIQIHDDIQDFFYIPLESDNKFTGIRFGNAVIDISGNHIEGEDNDNRIAISILSDTWYNEGSEVSSILINKDSMNLSYNDEKITMDSDGITMEAKRTLLKPSSSAAKLTLGENAIAEGGTVGEGGGPFYCGSKICPVTGILLSSNVINNIGEVKIER